MKRTEPPGEVFLSTERSVHASSGRERFFINATLIRLYQRPQPQPALSGYNTRSIIHRSVEWSALPMEEYALNPEGQQQTLEEAKEEAEGEKRDGITVGDP